MGIRSTREAPYLARLYDTMEWQRLAPDFAGKLVTKGGAKNGDADYVPAAIADNGKFALAYLPSQKTVTVNLAALSDKSFPGKSLRAHWFDPTNGKRQEAAPAELSNKGEHDFTPPTKNSAGEPDFVLLLETN